MKVSNGQLNSLKRYWMKIAKSDGIVVEQIKDTVYCYCSEWIMLRLLAAYSNNGKVAISDTIRMGYSENLKTHYFCIDL